MGAKVKLSVWDLSGKDEHKALREFAYSKADVVIFCFSLA
jgi:GTPase SAR1 family protein